MAAVPAFSPDGRLIIVPKSPFAWYDLWRVADGRWYGQLVDLTWNYPGLDFELVGFTPDSRNVMGVTTPGMIVFWPIHPGDIERPLVCYNQETAGASVHAFSPDGTLFVYGCRDGRVALARTPLLITEARRSGDQLLMSWLGGGGRYQVQQRSSLTDGAWENLGEPVSEPTFATPLTGPARFFRVTRANE